MEASHVLTNEIDSCGFRRYFPHVDRVESTFVPALLRSVNRVKNFTDQQLAKAVYSARIPTQTSEGLFLSTVVNHLATIVATRQQQPNQASGLELKATLASNLTEVSQALKKQGMEDLATRVHLLDLDSDTLLDTFDAIEREITTRLRQRTPIDVFRAELDKELKPYRAKMSNAQLARLEAQFIDRKLMEAAGIPRLTVL